MKFESIALRSLFVSCILICIVTISRMLFVPHPVPAAPPAAEVAAATVLSPLPCPFLPDGVLCVARD